MPAPFVDPDTGAPAFLVLKKNTTTGQYYVAAVTESASAPSAALFNTLSNTPQQVKNGKGIVYGWNIINPNLTNVYVKLFDANVVNLGVTVPNLVILVPAGGAVILHEISPIRNYIYKIWVACTASASITDTTAPALPVHCEIEYR